MVRCLEVFNKIKERALYLLPADVDDIIDKNNLDSQSYQSHNNILVLLYFLILNDSATVT